MESNARKIENPKKLIKVLRKIKPAKVIHAKNHLGKVKWNVDAVEYQKRLR